MVSEQFLFWDRYYNCKGLDSSPPFRKGYSQPFEPTEIKGASNSVYDASTNVGTFYCISCVNVTIKNLNLNNNGYGIFFWNTSQSKIQNVTSSNNSGGISLSYSSNNILISNNASNNYNGITLLLSSNNTLNGNNASNNFYYDQWGNFGRGIDLTNSSNNILIGNNASNNGIGINVYVSNNGNTLSDNNVSNNSYGIRLHYSSNITLNGNNVSNNGLGIFQYSSSKNNRFYNNFFNNTNYIIEGTNYWNTTKTSGKNIAGGPYLGGNFWANPDGTGFSQICPDVNSDGICDQSYILDANNIDYLPLSKIPSGFGYISGRILNNSIVIDNAIVSTNTSNTTNTDASGSYSLLVPEGTYKLKATGEPGFYPNSSITATVVAGTTLMQDIELIKKPIGNITGNVKKLTGTITGNVTST